MRNELLGYLLEALDGSEQEQVERELQTNYQLRSELDLLRRGLEPLADDEHYEPPAGLAERTIQYVFVQWALTAKGPAAKAAAVALPPPAEWNTPAATRAWRFADISVAAGILVAAMAVVVPAINQSRAIAQRIACQNNLSNNYKALASYAERHNGVLPVAEDKGRFAAAGIYAPRLASAGLLDDVSTLLCPGSPLTEELTKDGGFRVPLTEDIEKASPEVYEAVAKTMGGSYAMALGYRQGRKYRALRNGGGGDNYPIMSDLPGEKGMAIGHHGGLGENLLFKSGRTSYVIGGNVPGRRDHIHLNHANEEAPGVGENDAVVVPSHVRAVSQ